MLVWPAEAARCRSARSSRPASTQVRNLSWALVLTEDELLSRRPVRQRSKAPCCGRISGKDSYFGFESLERLPNSGDLTFVYRRYEKTLKALSTKAYRETLQRLTHVPEPWLIDELREEVARRGLSRAAVKWLDQKGLHAPLLRYFCLQTRATEQERQAALGEVNSPEEFKKLRAMARRFGDRAMQSALGELAHARRSRCGLVDPPVVTDEYRRTCEEWSRLARQYPQPP